MIENKNILPTVRVIFFVEKINAGISTLSKRRAFVTKRTCN